MIYRIDKEGKLYLRQKGHFNIYNSTSFPEWVARWRGKDMGEMLQKMCESIDWWWPPEKYQLSRAGKFLFLINQLKLDDVYETMSPEDQKKAYLKSLDQL